MTLPLPNWRSIWDRAPCRAVSRAFEGSWMLMRSTLGRGADRTSVLREVVTELEQCRGRASRSRRQLEPERRAFALDAIEADVAAVGDDDLLGQREPEPGPADACVRPRDPEELLEDPPLGVGRDPEARVAHRHADDAVRALRR